MGVILGKSIIHSPWYFVRDIKFAMQADAGLKRCQFTIVALHVLLVWTCGIFSLFKSINVPNVQQGTFQQLEPPRFYIYVVI